MRFPTKTISSDTTLIASLTVYQHMYLSGPENPKPWGFLIKTFALQHFNRQSLICSFTRSIGDKDTTPCTLQSTVSRWLFCLVVLCCSRTLHFQTSPHKQFGSLGVEKQYAESYWKYVESSSVSICFFKFLMGNISLASGQVAGRERNLSKPSRPPWIV